MVLKVFKTISKVWVRVFFPREPTDEERTMQREMAARRTIPREEIESIRVTADRTWTALDYVRKQQEKAKIRAVEWLWRQKLKKAKSKLVLKLKKTLAEKQQMVKEVAGFKKENRRMAARKNRVVRRMEIALRRERQEKAWMNEELDGLEKKFVMQTKEWNKTKADVYDMKERVAAYEFEQRLLRKRLRTTAEEMAKVTEELTGLKEDTVRMQSEHAKSSELLTDENVRLVETLHAAKTELTLLTNELKVCDIEKRFLQNWVHDIAEDRNELIDELAASTDVNVRLQSALFSTEDERSARAAQTVRARTSSSSVPSDVCLPVVNRPARDLGWFVSSALECALPPADTMLRRYRRRSPSRLDATLTPFIRSRVTYRPLGRSRASTGAANLPVLSELLPGSRPPSVVLSSTRPPPTRLNATRDGHPAAASQP